MADFQQFVADVGTRLSAMSKGELFVVGDGLDRDSLWLTFLESFPAGTNLRFRERSEYDCSTCRGFVKNFGNVVEIQDGHVRTLWSGVSAFDPVFSVVAAAMDEFVGTLPLSGIFRSTEAQYGTKTTRTLRDGQVEVWHHLHGRVADRHRTTDVGPARGAFDAAVQVFQRGLAELTPHALDTVVDLIDDNALYRGEEHRRAVTEFRSLRNQWAQAADGRVFVFANAMNPAARFRNTVIGTLVQDLSEGVDLEQAVRSFETKVAPQNYQRPTALITPAMVKAAMKTIGELGLEESLQRRFARLSDVSVNNVLWVDNDTRSRMKDGIEGLLMQAATTRPSGAGGRDAKPEEVPVVAFMKDILPGAASIDLWVGNSHEPHFVSLTTGRNPAAPPLFTWDNDFAWSYGGNVTDSIREKVKRAGGNVTGKLRVSLSWFNHDDLDLHVYEPDGTHIWYQDKRHKLDVDMNASSPLSDEPVENVTWAGKIADGEYRIEVNQFRKRDSSRGGFVIETESAGKVEHYSYERAVAQKETVEVGRMTVAGEVITAFRPGKDMRSGSAGKDLWGITTEQFVPVSTIMYSPNYFDDNEVGNRHYFFMLKDCVNDQPTRGIYNEFLRRDLQPHRKVFEVLGDRTKCEPTSDQLSGLGFSSTVRNSVVAKVTMNGGRRRLISIQF
ncbi:hypothetical protein Aph02nite_24610 [Actinoplanes philippinensis]|uniref:Uncharacterized protein n=1 Tax=Actinoplanes philippinensis TaxID=35752 RepID=A0A1I2G226_9ACTN|nr:hypothetical protein [Actinoplanes philippinensis]GIE76511.1 hypothetical protein Aph02nite_24610 [Actinoplanes philippinensis]SFF11179.1 hypothetical protein SAMN05421541_106120 [Actinoplanes philippinensis]